MIASYSAPRYTLRMLRSVCLIALSLCTIAPAADWSQWRGPNRDGKSAETGLLAQWPAGGPRLVWKVQGLGEGYSSFAVVGNRLYTQGQIGDQEYVMAFDVATGKQIWKTPTGRALSNDRGNGPRGTPTVDGKRLYAVVGQRHARVPGNGHRQARLGNQFRYRFQRHCSRAGDLANRPWSRETA